MTPTPENKPESEGQVDKRLLVCIGPNPSADRLIRTVKEMADNLHTEWCAVYVEDPRMLRQQERVRNQAVYNLRLAEQLGAETVTLRGNSIAAEIINFARQRKITTIIAGKPTRSLWQSILLPSPVDELVRLGGEIDITVMTGKIEGHKEPPVLVHPKIIRRAEYEMAFFYFILATGLSFLMYPYFELSNLIMVYLVGVMVTAIHCGRRPAILNSVLSVLGFDFFFVPPRFSLAVEENHYILTFVVMFLVALVISHFTVLIRRQAEAARLQERQTAAMLALSQQLASIRGLEAILQVAVKYISEIFECEVVALLPNGTDRLRVAAGDSSAVFQKDFLKELNVAQEAYKTGQLAGWETQKSAGTEILHAPLQAGGVTLGVLALRPSDPYGENWLLPEQMRFRFLESLAKQVAFLRTDLSRKSLVGPVRAGLDGAGRDAEALGDLCVRVTLQVLHPHDVALVGGELVDGLADLPGLVPLLEPGRHRHQRGIGRRHGLQVLRRPASLAAVDVDGDPTSDGGQPWGELAVGLEPARGLPCLDEGLLGGVLGELFAAEGAQRNRVDQAPVLAVHRPDARFLPPTKRFDECRGRSMPGGTLGGTAPGRTS